MKKFAVLMVVAVAMSSLMACKKNTLGTKKEMVKMINEVILPIWGKRVHFNKNTVNKSLWYATRGKTTFFLEEKRGGIAHLTVAFILTGQTKKEAEQELQAADAVIKRLIKRLDSTGKVRSWFRESMRWQGRQVWNVGGAGVRLDYRSRIYKVRCIPGPFKNSLMLGLSVSAKHEKK